MSFGFGFSPPASGATPGGPTLNLQFAGVTTLDPRITFTRASTGTYFDSAGVLRSATYNLLTYSEQFDNAAWAKGNTSINQNATTAPDGTLTADKLVEDTATAEHILVQGTPVVGRTETFSIYARAAERTRITLGGGGFTAQGFSALFDLSTGTLISNTGNKASISDVGNGWYRCSISFVPSTTVTYRVSLIDANNNSTYTGNGTSGVFVWGAQLEQASTAGPYYATTTAANGAPRLTFNPTTLAPQGLLVEEQRTNLLTYSAEFDNAAWTKTNSSITANTVVAPDGTLTGDKLVENTATAEHIVGIGGISISASASTTVSFFVKAAERTACQIRISSGNGTFSAAICLFDLSAVTVTPSVAGGAVSASGTITSVGNGWFRCTVTGVLASDVTQVGSNLRLSNGGGNTNYTGDGTSGLFLWGAQLEAGAFPTSYIPTVASQATRAADSASMTGTNFSNWYNATEGTLYAEFGPYANAGVSGNTGIAQIYGATSSDTIRLFGGATTVPVFQVSVGGVSQAYLNVGTLIPANTTKLVGAYKADDFAKSLNGGAIDSDTSGTVPTVNQMLIGSGTGGITSLNGTIARIAFYPRRLTNAELQGITA